MPPPAPPTPSPSGHPPDVPPAPGGETSQDLGFGRVVASESALRLLNRDGSFNVERSGLGYWASWSAYHALLTMPWSRFLAWLGLVYAGFNAVFALGFLALGPSALDAPEGDPAGFWRAFFFSVQTFATIGYGRITAAGWQANALVAVEAFVGIVAAALTTGLVFARFARPTAALRFSRNALVGPFPGGRALMFRVVNTRRTEIIEVDALAILALFEVEGDRRVRRFYPLPLERPHVVFFPLAWTVVHPITADTPLGRLTAAELLEGDAEILVLLKGIDDVAAHQVHARTSYHAADLVWDARFSDIFVRGRDGRLGVDVSRLDDYDAAP